MNAPAARKTPAQIREEVRAADREEFAKHKAPNNSDKVHTLIVAPELWPFPVSRERDYFQRKGNQS